MRREFFVPRHDRPHRGRTLARRTASRRGSGQRRLLLEQLEDRRVLSNGGPGLLAAPVVDAGPDVMVREGSVFRGFGSFADPDSQSWTATVDYGDGSGPRTLLPFLDKSFELRHTYADNGVFTVTVAVRDQDQLAGSDTLQVTVENVAPSLFVRGRQTVFEGPVLISDIGMFIDPGFDNPAGGTVERISYSMDWGDGTALDVGSATILVPGRPGVLTRGTFDGGHTYADEGRYVAAITVSDDDNGSSVTRFVTMMVENAPPEITELQLDRSEILEGDTAVLTGAFTDPGSRDTHTVSVDWGDGATGDAVVDPVTRTFTAEHRYRDNPPASPFQFTISVTVRDNSDGVVTQTLPITVNPAPPVVDAGADQTANENQEVAFSGSFVDPGELDTHTILWDFGDGATATGTLTPTHVFADDGVYTVTLTVTDNDQLSGTGTLTVTVLNVPPTLTVPGPQTVAEGALLELQPIGQFRDPGFTNPAAGSSETFTYSIDWGDGSPVTSGVPTITQEGAAGIATEGEFNGQHAYANSGTYTVTVTVADDDGGTAAETIQVTVLNVPPTLTVPGPQTVAEGALLELQPIGQFRDPGFTNPAGTGDAFTYSIDWGDGSPVTSGVPTITQEGAPGMATEGEFNGQHVYADNGTYTVTVTVTDDDGGTATETIQVTVTNVAPTLRVIGNQVATVGVLIELANVGVFTDPGFTNPAAGTSETFTYSINWGDDSPLSTGPARIDQPGSAAVPTSGSFDGSHTYLQAGIFVVTVRVTDDDAGFDEEQLEIVVSDPAVPDEEGEVALEPMMGPLLLSTAPAVAVTLPEISSLSDEGPREEAPSAVLDGEVPAYLPATSEREKGTDDEVAMNEESRPDFTVAGSAEVAATTDVGVGEEADENQTPIVFGPGNVSIAEGAFTVEEVGVFLDMDSMGPFEYRIDWGDGSVPATGTATVDFLGPPTFGSFSGSHGYRDDGFFEASLSVTDEQGGTGTEVYEITVINVPPRLENVTITSPISEGSTATVRGEIVDPGLDDTFVLVITWGDGATDTFEYPAGTTTFRETHRYQNNLPGNAPYPVRLAVTDDDEPDNPHIADLLVVVENLPPTAVDDIYAHVGGGDLVVDAAQGVLANDTDPGNDGLTAVEYGPPTAGTLVGNPDGSFTFTPPRANFSGVVRFTYRAMDSDGAISESAASVTIDSALRASISGSVRAILPSFGGVPTALGVPGVTITLTEVTSQNVVQTTTLTGDDGSYRFDGLRAGTYLVTESQPAALFPFSPDSATVVLQGNDARTGVDFQEGWLRTQTVSLRNFFASAPTTLDALTPAAIRHLIAQGEDQAGRPEQAAAIRQGGSQTTVVITPGAGDDNVVFLAGSTHHRVTVNGSTHIFVASAVEGFRIDGGEGQDNLRLVGSPSDDLVTLRPAGELSTMQLPNYALTPGPNLVRVERFETIAAEGGGGYDRAVLYDSPGDDLLEAGGNTARLLLFERDDLWREAVDFDVVRAVGTAGGVNSQQLGGAVDFVLETVGEWIDV